jgi:hypothetical protein
VTGTPTRATGSRLDLFRRCQAWALPSAIWADKESESARRGSAIHAVIAWFVGAMLDRWTEAVADVCQTEAILWDVDPAELSGLIATWIHHWAIHGVPHRPGWKILVEVSYAWNPHTGTVRRLPLGTTRDQRQDDPAEIVMTLDLVAWGPDGQIVILDHKSGGAPSAAEAAQLLGGALVVVREAEAAGQAVGKVEVEIHQIAEDGSILRDVATPSAWDLASFEDEIRELLSNPSPEAVPGSWCVEDYCPALLECPITKAQVPQLIPVEDLIRAPIPAERMAAIVTPEDLARYLMIKAKAERVMEDLKAQARALVDASGGAVPLPDGRVYRTIDKQRAGFDASKARELLGDRAAECDRVTRFVEYRITGTAEGATSKKRRAKTHVAAE